MMVALKERELSQHTQITWRCCSPDLSLDDVEGVSCSREHAGGCSNAVLSESSWSPNFYISDTYAQAYAPCNVKHFMIHLFCYIKDKGRGAPN
jgi:hypothetical protein